MLHGGMSMGTLKRLFQFLIGLTICMAGLVILWLDMTTTSIANGGSYFFELGLGLAIAGGAWAVIQVRQIFGIAKAPEPQPANSQDKRSDLPG
jgi:ABC-type nickel/cobalt efflux system permease component RcnA